MVDLNAKYNPEGSVLRKQQKILLSILDDFDEICKKNNLTYWLGSGTLLGAFRHKGFIPWDDDIDLEMPLTDYRKMLKLIGSELPKDLLLQTINCDKEYLLPYAKIKHTDSIIEEQYDIIHPLDYKYKGLFIDIFPLYKKQKLLSPFLWKCFGRCILYLRTNRFFLKFKFLILNIFFCKVCLPIEQKLSTWFGNKDEYCLPLFFSSVFLSDIYPLQEIEFEGKKYPAPYNTPGYLSEMYGDDYMQIPDLSKIQTHIINFKLLDRNKRP